LEWIPVRTNVRPGAGIRVYVLECESRLRERVRGGRGRETRDRAKLLVPVKRRECFNHLLILSPSDRNSHLLFSG